MPKDIGQVMWDTYEDPLVQLLGNLKPAQQSGVAPIYIINDPASTSVYVCNEPFTIADVWSQDESTFEGDHVTPDLPGELYNREAAEVEFDAHVEAGYAAACH